jgi:hypothetical protein
MTAATATFLEISNALTEMQSQQQLLYSGFTHAKDKSSASEQSLNARNAKDVSDAYEKARTALSEHINVLARKAEIYIDWPSDIGRDAAAKRNVNDDPLSSSLLRAYDFNCADRANFPRFGDVNFTPPKNDHPVPELSDKGFCRRGRQAGCRGGNNASRCLYEDLSIQKRPACDQDLLVQRQARGADNALLPRSRA